MADRIGHETRAVQMDIKNPAGADVVSIGDQQCRDIVDNRGESLGSEG